MPLFNSKLSAENRIFTKITEIAKPISDLTISNNLRVGGTSLAGSIEKTLVIPTATADPLDSLNNLIKLTPEQSGTTFILTQNVGPFNQVFVLPPGAIGLNYTFIVQDATATSTISIMPYGYTVTGGNLAPGANIISEAYDFSIQAVVAVGDVTGGYQQSSSKTDQINSVVGVGGVTGGIMFTDSMVAPASLKLTCVSTAVAGTALGGVRWIGTGQAGLADDINVSA